MKAFRLLSTLTLLSALTACNVLQPFPTTPRSAYIDSCIDKHAEWQMSPNEAASICACAFDRVSSRYGNNWMQNNPDSHPALSRFVVSSVRQCARRPPADPSHRSIRTHRDDFLALCTSYRHDPMFSSAQIARNCVCTYDTLRGRYSTAQWQHIIRTGTSLESDPVLKRRTREAAETCVRRHLIR